MKIIINYYSGDIITNDPNIKLKTDKVSSSSFGNFRVKAVNCLQSAHAWRYPDPPYRRVVRVKGMHFEGVAMFFHSDKIFQLTFIVCMVISNIKQLSMLTLLPYHRKISESN